MVANFNSNPVRVAVAAALGLVAGSANAAIPLGTGDTYANEIAMPTGGTSLTENAVDDMVISHDGYKAANLFGVDNKKLTVSFTLSNGATFAANPQIACPVAITGPTGGAASGDITGTLVVGGVSANSATFVFDLSAPDPSAGFGLDFSAQFSADFAQVANGIAYLASGASDISDVCTLTAVSGVDLYSIGSVDGTVTRTVAVAGTNTTTTETGSVIKFDRGLGTYFSGGAGTNTASAQLQVTASFQTFQASATTANLGTVGFLSAGSAVEVSGQGIIASGVISGGTLTIQTDAFGDILGATGGSVFLATANTCSGADMSASTTVSFVTGGTTATFTLTQTAVDSLSGGDVNVCVVLPGDKRITAGAVTASFTPNPTANRSVNGGAIGANTLGNITKNGITITSYNVPNSGSADGAFLRLYNTSSTAGDVNVTVYGQDGAQLCNSVEVVTSLAANAVEVVTPGDIETACGISAWSGRARVVFDFETTAARVQSLVRTNNVLTNMSPVSSANN